MLKTENTEPLKQIQYLRRVQVLFEKLNSHLWWPRNSNLSFFLSFYSDSSFPSSQESAAGSILSRMNPVTFCIYKLFSLFWRNKSRLMRSPCCLCVCESPPLLTFETLYVYHGTWAHLNGLLHKSLHQSACLSLFSLLCRGSVKCIYPSLQNNPAPLQRGEV
jgi:hypothetical protein